MHLDTRLLRACTSNARGQNKPTLNGALMDVRGLIWMGIDTLRYRETVGFSRDVLGLAAAFENRTQSSSSAQTAHGFRSRAASDSCPVPLFEVDDLRATLQELREASTPVVSEIREDEAWQWIEVLGPAGHRYEFAARK
jgi:hypothetical protein